ncbi:MAG: hypothetical protein ABS43_17835 [Bordetella sp. SCN 67-23]|nr:porin [Burkholderiales bacterium]ODS72373.1 MAG: hypothetical protein ABS43_17835 [Bordetella sp. SCN 67-23]ODU66649.1 MAG: hypothetical protein ABT00_21890 [Bordetella sp. SCN 68-11]OJW86847.1 MAG: hypothetical protein BGO71_26275 [Burkholderiales bacterium 67-32]
MKLGLSGGLALALVSLPCLAQSPAGNVTLYGAIDTGVEYITHASASGGSGMRMPTLTGGQLPSRWGLRGSEDLGNGWRGIFNLESGFFADSGSSGQAGRLFGRTAIVGVEGPWGSFTLGRQSTMLTWSLMDADVIGPSVFSMASFDSYIPNARADNSLAYRGRFGGLTVGATYSLGRDTSAAGNCGGERPGDAQACRGWSGLLKYDGGGWGVAAAIDEQHGGPGAAPAVVVPGVAGVAIASSDSRDRRYMANGYVHIADLKLGAGWLHRRIEGSAADASTNLYFVGATYPIGSWTLNAQASRMIANAYQAKGTMLVGRASYSFSKRTAAYAMLAHMGNSGAGAVFSVSSSSIVPWSPKAGQGQMGVMVGLRHSF